MYGFPPVKFLPGGLLMLSMLVFFTDMYLLAALLGNVILHELGHIYCLKSCGVYIRCVKIGFTGLCIQCSLERLSPRAYFLCAAAGPAVGLLAAFATSFIGNILNNKFLLLFAGCGLILSTFNLLPVRPLDGWRMLSCVWPKGAGVIGDLTASAIFGIGVCMMLQGYGTMLVCLGIFFLLQGRKDTFFVK